MNFLDAAISNAVRSILERMTDLEVVQTQAKAVGMSREFEVAWAYEQGRARERPGAPLTPKEVLQLVIANVS